VTEPIANMTPRDVRSWMRTEAWADYRDHRDAARYDGYTRYVCRRTIDALTGEASDRIVEKQRRYVKRHRAQEAGRRRFGSGPAAVSGHTAGLRNWGWDPTGRFS
jgi:hypothetical protein